MTSDPSRQAADRVGRFPCPLRLVSDGPDRTRAIASVLAEAMVVGDLLVLQGDLGAGKTCFTQGLGAGLGVVEAITSPTFTLANRYRGRLVLHHLDAYRLEGEDDATDLDLDDLLETGVTVIEWGDRIEGLLPAERFTIILRSPDPAAPAEPGAADEPAELDRRIIEIDGPVVERGIDHLLAGWVAP